MPKAYVIARIRVTDPARYDRYLAIAPEAFAAFDGKIISTGEKAEMIEGEAEARRLLLLEFPSYQAAKDFYASDVYPAIRALRADAAEAQFILVEGRDR